MKLIRRAIYTCLWGISVWADNRSMQMLRKLSETDETFRTGHLKNELTNRQRLWGMK